MNEKVNRIYVDGHEQSRLLHKKISSVPPTADFCAVCGHWTSASIITADDKKCCISCNTRISQLMQ